MKLQFGLHFFPDVTQAEKSAETFYAEALQVVDLFDELGLSTVRIVEHYFEHYGGYSPNPLVFLAAACQRAREARLMPGALLPVFNHPLKMAGEIGMLDAISGGRLDVGFARAFLPHEFQRFGVSMDDSRARFDEGVEAVRRLLEEENVSFEGEFHSFQNVTSLPRPTQKPRPPIWIAVLSTPQSFVDAGRNGYNIMANPLAADKLAELLELYRESWRSAGHPGEGQVMISFRMHCDSDRERALATMRGPTEAHQVALVDCASLHGGWGEGMTSKDYPGYEKIIARLREETYEELIAKGSVWVGTPEDVHDQIVSYYELVGGFDIASLNGHPHLMPLEANIASLRLFAAEVMPVFGASARAA